MPWCEACAHYWAPSAMSQDGACPTCGEVLAEQRPITDRTITAKNVDVRKLAAGEDGDTDVQAPWHFKLLMVLLVLYLGWRIVDLFV
jgi:hypothetical protein